MIVWVGTVALGLMTWDFSSFNANVNFVTSLFSAAFTEKISTYALFVFSPCRLSYLFALQLCGCGLLGVGIWLSVSQGSFATFSPSFPSLSAANMVIAIGAIVMVTGFLGCLGAIKENKCLLLSVSYI